MSVGDLYTFGYTARVRNRFKHLLMVFMMLALPVQTFASAALLGCELSRAAPETQVAMDHGMSVCHDAPADKPDMPVGEHQCGHCAACYLAAAFPIPAASAALVTPIPYSPYLQTSESFSGFIPEGPERPPRTSRI